MKFIDLIGRRFGKLTVIKYYGKNKNNQNIWLCKCDCGNEIIVNTGNLNKGNVKSCGCLQKEKAKEANLKYCNIIHDKTFIRLKNIYNCMKYRCKNKYKSKNIKICDEWLNFENFYNWSINNGFNINANDFQITIDRINNDGDCEPSNCRWVNQYTQSRNKSNVKLYEYNKECLCIKDLAKKYNIKYSTLYKRLNSGQSIEQALTAH